MVEVNMTTSYDFMLHSSKPFREMLSKEAAEGSRVENSNKKEYRTGGKENAKKYQMQNTTQ